MASVSTAESKSWAPTDAVPDSYTNSSHSSVNASDVGETMTVTSYDTWETIVICASLLFIIVGTIIGNILVCIAVCLVRRLRRPCNYLLVSLAVSDLCVALLVMPMALVYEVLGSWPFGPRACDAWVACDVLSCTASILNLCMISVDRYWAITRPLDYGVKRTPTRMCCCVALVWISSACISLPPLLVLGNEHVGADGDAQCTVCQEFGYQIYATLGSFYIPLSVMAAVYYKIFQAAKRIVDEEKKAQSHLMLTRSSASVRRPPESAVQMVVQQSASDPTSVGTSTVAIGRVDQHQATPWPDVCSNAVRCQAGARASLDIPRCDANHRRRCSSETTTADLHEEDAISLHQEQQASLLNQQRPSAASQPADGVNQQPHSKLRLRFALNKERKASTTLGIIMSAFTLCWFPFFVLALVRPFVAQPDLVIPRWLSSLFLWLGYANSFLNPVIYATTNKDFRLPFKEILCLRCKSLNSVMREDFYQSQYGAGGVEQPSAGAGRCVLGHGPAVHKERQDSAFL